MEMEFKCDRCGKNDFVEIENKVIDYRHDWKIIRTVFHQYECTNCGERYRTWPPISEEEVQDK